MGIKLLLVSKLFRLLGVRSSVGIEKRARSLFSLSGVDNSAAEAPQSCGSPHVFLVSGPSLLRTQSSQRSAHT